MTDVVEQDVVRFSCFGSDDTYTIRYALYMYFSEHDWGTMGGWNVDSDVEVS